MKPSAPPIPVLTDEVRVDGMTTQAWLVRELPTVLASALAEMQPHLEQQLLDALMPRLLASLAQAQANSTPSAADGVSRLP